MGEKEKLEYERLLNELNDSPIANQIIRKNYGKNIDEIYNLIQKAYLDYTSYDWFNGDHILVYPKVREVKATKLHVSFYGAPIYKGSIYYNYNALLINLTNKSKYVLTKPLRFEIGDDIPYGIEGLEKLERNTGREIARQKVRKSGK